MTSEHNVIKFPLRDFKDDELSEEHIEEEIINLGKVGDLASENNDNSLESPPPPPQFNPINPEKIESMRSESYEKGFLDGKNSADSECEKRFSEQSGINNLLVEALKNAEIEKTESFENLGTILSDILELSIKKLATSSRCDDIGRLKDFINNIITSVDTSTTLTVMLNSDLYSNNKAYIDELIQSHSKANILPSDKINISDCKIEWSDGCATLDTDRIFQEISSKLQSINDNNDTLKD